MGTQFHATPPEIPPQTVPSSESQISGNSTFSSTRSTTRTRTKHSSPKLTPTGTPTETPTLSEKLPVQPIFTTPLRVTKSLASSLPYLTTQKPHYISAHLHARPYLLTEGDQLRLPFLMPGVQAGDVLRLNRASALGSRDYTLKGTPYVDERLFECRVRVLGVESEPLRVKEKTKRRQRHVQRIKSKHKYTIMRVIDVKVKTLEELVDEGVEILEDGDAKVEKGDATIETKAQ